MINIYREIISSPSPIHQQALRLRRVPHNTSPRHSPYSNLSFIRNLAVNLVA